MPFSSNFIVCDCADDCLVVFFAKENPKKTKQPLAQNGMTRARSAGVESLEAGGWPFDCPRSRCSGGTR